MNALTFYTAIRRLLITLFLLTAGIFQPAAAQFYLNQDASLTDINALLVVVEFSGDTDAIDGLAADEIRRETTRKLRAADLRLLSERAWAQEEGQPYLHLHINSIDSELGFFVYRIEAALYQEVHLLRQPDKSTIVPTWETTELGFAGENRLASLREDMFRLVDGFINALQAENSGE